MLPGDADFEQVSRTFTFPAENDTACTTIAVVEDRVALEGAEQFTVELTLPPGQPGLLLGTDRQTTITIIDNDGRTATLPVVPIICLNSLCIHFAVVSVEFADRSIEVSEGVGEVTVCLLKNSTTAINFSVTVASVESSPVSAEGLYRDSWA